jgi:hypothetical protein
MMFFVYHPAPFSSLSYNTFFVDTPSLRNSIIVVALNKQGYMENNVVEPDQLCQMLEIERRQVTPITTLISCNARLGAGVLDIFTFLAGALPWSE